MFLGNLVQDLAGLREAAVLGLQSLQAEQHRLEEEIQKAQERHQTVREPQSSEGRSLLMHCMVGQLARLLLRKRSSCWLWWLEETFTNQSNSWRSGGVNQPFRVAEMQKQT